MKTLTQLSLAALLLALTLAPLRVLAAPIAYSFRVTDSSGNLVPGATVQVGSTALTAGSATTIPTAAGEKLLNTNAAPATAPSVTLLDYGTGDYSLVYDTTTAGELYLPLSVSKSGSTFSGASALIALITPADPNNSLTAATNTGTLITGQANLTTGQGTIINKTNLIATNAGDSPNEQAQQNTVTTNLNATVSSRSTYSGGAVASVTAPVTVGTNSDKTGYTVSTVQDKTGYMATASNLPTFPANFPALAINSSGYVTTANPAAGGSSVTESSIWNYATRSLTAQADTPGTTTILSNYARRTDIPATVSLSAGDEIKIGQIGADTPGVTLLLGRPAQTGDTFGLVSPLIASGKFTGAALSNAPVSAGGVTDASVTADVGSALGTAGIPAATVSAMKSDAVLSRTFNRSHGAYTYNLTTHVMTLLNDDGTTLGTVTLTADPATGTITGKQ